MKGKARASSRANRKKGKRTMKVLLLALLLGLAAGGVFSLGQSGFFDIKNIYFKGNRNVSDERLKWFMGIYGGEKIWRISLKELAGGLSESPWVKGVSLRKDYPRSLYVRIEEAVPVALMRKGGSLCLIDSEGAVLERLRGESVPFLPVIVDNPKKDPRTFREAVVLAGVIRDSGLSAKKERVEIKGLDKGAPHLRVDIDGLLVKVGEGRYGEKFSKLFELLDEIRRRDIDVEYVDLRFDDRVVVKPVAGVVGEK
jgi:cell division protein FtsQ